MAVLTTTALVGLIVGGVAVVSAGVGMIWHASTEKERIQEAISQLENENRNLSSFKNDIEYLKRELSKSITYLKDGENIFEDGGHVSSGKPLAYSEFISCVLKLENGVKNADSLIGDLNATIQSNNKKINELKASK